MSPKVRALALLLGLAALAPAHAAADEAPPPAMPATLIEPPLLEAGIAAGSVPPMAQRIPATPAIYRADGPDQALGAYGGTWRMMGGSAKDTRLLYIYGYARLVGYDTEFRIVPDIALKLEVEEGRRFTFHLRPGHRWSDGAPFTSEDFRYYWEDIATLKEMSKYGPPKDLLVDGKRPVVEFPDAHTVRYTWPTPNPNFLPALAAAQPLEIYRPAHYLKRFHPKYNDPEALAKAAKAAGQRNAVAMHFFMDRAYRNDNPDLPTLQPWVLRTPPPAQRFMFERNPYFHRIDTAGRQMPYIDRVALMISNSALIAAKAASGEADLQSAYLTFSNYPFLKQAEKRSKYHLRRWVLGKGSRMALFPNLNVADPEWRKLFREADFRRALSLAINRQDINNAIFYGLASVSNNTVLPESPLFREDYRSMWTRYDPEEADRLLDGLGLTKRDSQGLRLLPDGRPMQIVVETAGDESEQSDVLGLVREDWRRIGIELFVKATQREMFRNRVKSGMTHISVWTGLENAVPNAGFSPKELAPLTSDDLQWPQWGSWEESAGKLGEKPSLPAVQALIELRDQWGHTADPARQEAIWHEMLGISADQVFSIGLVTGVDQLIVVSDLLRNVPKRGIYNFDPGAFFGIYRPDTFWFDEKDANIVKAEKTQ
jgi:peptide/nickel transport system substrate-binding protein